MTDISKKIALILLFAFALVSCKEDEALEEPKVEEPIEEPVVIEPLKSKAKFGIGAAVTASALNEAAYSSAVKESFTQLTAEYEMKMGHIWKGSSSYDWSKVDALSDYAKQNNMKIHGHTLLWYRSFPTWFTDAKYDSVTFETMVKEYITATVSRYKGAVASWDVANEIFNNNGTLRVDDAVYATFSDPIGFYGRCFQYAREADPSCKLFYNDYDLALFSGKRYALKLMVERFQKEGYPIDGIGDQSHYTTSTSQATIRTGILDLASTGLLIHISELDIRVNVNKSDSYVFSVDQQQVQADAYQGIVEIFEEIPQEQKFAITTWGITDKITWLTDWWHPKEYPLLFDANYAKKKAYDGFFLGLK